MDSSRDRLFRLPFVRPEFLNNANVRTAGVYLAGALVSYTLPDNHVYEEHI